MNVRDDDTHGAAVVRLLINQDVIDADGDAVLSAGGQTFQDLGGQRVDVPDLDTQRQHSCTVIVHWTKIKQRFRQRWS